MVFLPNAAFEDGFGFALKEADDFGRCFIALSPFPFIDYERSERFAYSLSLFIRISLFSFLLTYTNALFRIYAYK